MSHNDSRPEMINSLSFIGNIGANSLIITGITYFGFQVSRKNRQISLLVGLNMAAPQNPLKNGKRIFKDNFFTVKR